MDLGVQAEKIVVTMSPDSDFSFAGGKKLNSDPCMNWQKRIWKLMRISRGCFMKQAISWNQTSEWCAVMLLTTFCFTKDFFLYKKKVIFTQGYIKAPPVYV